MRYQIRLVDQYLPDFAHDLAQATWDEASDLFPADIDRSMYRELLHAVRVVLEPRVQAFRYCGAAHRCEQTLEPKALAVRMQHEAYPGEHVRIYLLVPGVEAGTLREALEVELLKTVARLLPGRKLKGLGPNVRRRLEKMFRGKVFRSEVCGDLPLCELNEPYDPWLVTERADKR